MKSTEATEKSRLNNARGAMTVWNVAATILFTVALVYVKDIVDGRHLRIPGHSGVYWMALLLMNRRYGMGRASGTIMGVGSGALTYAFFPQGGFGMIPAIGIFSKYVVAGAVVDILYFPPKRTVWSLLHWGVVGATGNALKFVALAVFKTFTASSSWSMMLGQWNSLALHILFGFIGGIAAFGFVSAFRIEKRN